MSNAAAEAVAGVLGDMFPETVAEATDTTSVEQPAPEETPEAPELNLPSFEADTTGLDFLDDEPEPDYEIEDDDLDEPIAAQAPEIDEFTDPEVAKVLAANKKLQAQLEHERGLRKQAKIKDWRSEASRRFPLCDAPTLNGDSRRAVLRAAKQQHDRVYILIKPYADAVKTIKTEVSAEVTAEARERAVQAWGQPTSGPSQAAIEAVELADQTQHDRKQYRNVHDSVLARVRKGFQI